MTSALDVHIGYFPPERWDKLGIDGPDVQKAVGGHERRPSVTSEHIEWATIGLQPRWVGDDTSDAVAAIEPNQFHQRGVDEWRRYRAGAERRGELVVAVSMIGDNEEPAPRSVLATADASVAMLATPMSFVSVVGDRVVLATPPELADGLNPADRDLALRLVSARDLALPWWGLTQVGGEPRFGGGGASQVMNHPGSLHPLLVSRANETVAAVWLSHDGSVRHYVLPWLPSWLPVLEWLSRSGIPELVPSASRRMHQRLGDDAALMTSDEVALREAINRLSADYQSHRAALQARLSEARSEADYVRHGLLMSKGDALETAVARVLADAGFEVERLDETLGRPASADLLVRHAGRRWLVEVKGVSGNASERLADSPRKHLSTWPELRPGAPVEGVVLVVNHQAGLHPLNRTPSVYARDEFVRSLTFPVVSTLELWRAWARTDRAAIQSAVTGDDTDAGGGEIADSDPPSPTETTADAYSNDRRWPHWPGFGGLLRRQVSPRPSEHGPTRGSGPSTGPK